MISEMLGLWILDYWGITWANWLLILGIAGIGGGIPPMIERRRRRSIENALPGMLSSLSDSIGAGQGLQQAMQNVVSTQDDLISNLLEQALNEGSSSTFESSLARFAVMSRSEQVQRAISITTTAVEQDAPLKEIMYRMSIDYERLNDLMNQRETDLSGRSLLIMMFICVGLPLLIAFLVGLFAPWSQGFQLGFLNNTFALFFCAVSMYSVAVSGRMLGRLSDVLWFLPIWGFIATYLYIVPYHLIGS
jgi:Flp pilus assembly protein TadB